MPWTVVTAGKKCPTGKPYAVVRADTGALVACHESKEQATKHMAALYANTKE
jgi:hypothetical protein